MYFDVLSGTGLAVARALHTRQLTHLPRRGLQEGSRLVAAARSAVLGSGGVLWRGGSEDSAARVRFRNRRANAGAETGGSNS